MLDGKIAIMLWQAIVVFNLLALFVMKTITPILVVFYSTLVFLTLVVSTTTTALAVSPTTTIAMEQKETRRGHRARAT